MIGANGTIQCGHLTIIHTLGLDRFLFPRLAKDRSRYTKFSKSLATQRTDQGDHSDRKDFFHYLLHAKDPDTGKSLSISELWAESDLLIIAGSDTPATAIAGVFYYLCHYPLVLRKLQQEIRATFTDIKEITNYANTNLTSCTYLRAVIDETLRMSPPVTGTLPREVLEDGMRIDGEYIPAGTVVGTGMYSMHHNPKYFSDPFIFKPERWIPGSNNDVTSESVRTVQHGFFPFSYGPRGCIGKNMAYMVMKHTIARTLWLYDMRVALGTTLGEVGDDEEPERKGEFALKDRWQAEKDGPMVQFRQRLMEPS